MVIVWAAKPTLPLSQMPDITWSAQIGGVQGPEDVTLTPPMLQALGRLIDDGRAYNAACAAVLDALKLRGPRGRKNKSTMDAVEAAQRASDDAADQVYGAALVFAMMIPEVAR